MSVLNSESCEESCRPVCSPNSSRFWLLAGGLILVVILLGWRADGSSRLLLVIYAMTFLFGCWKTRRATLCVLPGLYCPFLLLSIESAFTTGERYSVSFWSLPGRAAIRLVGWSLEEPWGCLVAALFFLVMVVLGRSSLRAAAISAVVTLAISAVLATSL